VTPGHPTLAATARAFGMESIPPSRAVLLGGPSLVCEICFIHGIEEGEIQPGT